MRVSAELLEPATDYFSARIWSAPAVLANYAFFGWFLGREESGKALVMTLSANLSNITLINFDQPFRVQSTQLQCPKLLAFPPDDGVAGLSNTGIGRRGEAAVLIHETHSKPSTNGVGNKSEGGFVGKFSTTWREMEGRKIRITVGNKIRDHCKA